MICYRDRTWCTAPCINADCDRRYTPEVETAAERWWGKPGAPVSLANRSERCPEFQAAEPTR